MTLVNLTASAHNNKVTLRWATLTEMDNRGFEVYRSTDGTNWQYAGFVAGAGNSNIRVDYSFEDNNLSPKKYYYRLKQVDHNGQYKFSNIAAVTLYDRDQYTLGQNFPNPFNKHTLIEFSVPSRQQVRIILMDMKGRTIRTLLDETRSAGAHTISFSNEGLSSGMYLYKMEAGGFSAVRKMIVR